MSSSELPFRSYRPDIDGLRAVAVMGVLLYHLNDKWISGGFVGVDVFFVISGFLISRIIDREMRDGTFSIARFYERRIRRIFPAFCVMLVAVIIASWFILLPDDFVAFAKSIRYAVIGISNILFAKNAQNYFNESDSPVPLLHTWSLGVEEQFYLVFPVLMWTIYRFFKSQRSRLALVSLLFVISLVTSALVVGHYPVSAFFHLQYRAWELLLGTLLALGNPPSLRNALSKMLGLVGVAMIAGSMFYFDESVLFPGPSALVPCMGTALLLWSGKDATLWINRILSMKPFVLIGRISYSVYLWHWPMIALASYLGEITRVASFLILLSSLMCGFLSWRFIEKPFRNPVAESRKRLFLAWAALSALTIVCGSMIEASKGFPKRYAPEVRRLLAFKEKPAYWKNAAKDAKNPLSEVVYGAEDVIPRYALWGDSHGTALVPVLDALGKISGEAFRKFGQGALPPVMGVVQTSESNPDERLRITRETLDLLVADRSIHTVLLHARWSLYNRGQNENHDVARASFFGVSFDSPDKAEAFYFSKIRETIDKLVASGKRVVVIGPVPEVGRTVPDMLAKQQIAGLPLSSTVACGDFF